MIAILTTAVAFALGWIACHKVMSGRLTTLDAKARALHDDLHRLVKDRDHAEATRRRERQLPRVQTGYGVPGK